MNFVVLSLLVHLAQPHGFLNMLHRANIMHGADDANDEMSRKCKSFELSAFLNRPIYEYDKATTPSSKFLSKGKRQPMFCYVCSDFSTSKIMFEKFRGYFARWRHPMPPSCTDNTDNYQTLCYSECIILRAATSTGSIGYVRDCGDFVKTALIKPNMELLEDYRNYKKVAFLSNYYIEASMCTFDFCNSDLDSRPSLRLPLTPTTPLPTTPTTPQPPAATTTPQNRPPRPNLSRKASYRRRRSACLALYLAPSLLAIYFSTMVVA